MTTGRVRQRRAIVEIEIADSDGSFQKVEAVIDTGYNGHLTLPVDLVAAFELSFAGYRSGTLADDSTVLLEVYVATIVWHDRALDVLALQSGSIPLIGMALMAGSRLTIEALDGGEVVIQELPKP